MTYKDKFNSKQRSIIRHWKSKIKDVKLYRKLEVLDYAAKGLSLKEICHLTDYSKSRISELVNEFIQSGIGYFLQEHRKGGNRHNLTDNQEKAIVAKFECLAKNGKVASLNDVKKEYSRVFGKEVANSTFYASNY